MNIFKPRITKIYIVLAGIITLLACFYANSTTAEIVEAPASETIPVVTIEFTEEVAEPVIEVTEPEEPFTVWKDNVFYESNIVEPSDVMAYTYLKPMFTDCKNEPKPLIVWLHGGGKKGLKTFSESNYNLTHVISTSELAHFDAYVISPVLYGDYYEDMWCLDSVADDLRAVIDKFISENNVDTENIIVCGGSMGGQGTVYMAANMDDYFSKAYILSGYHVYGIHGDDFKMPVKGYVGTYDDQKSISYMKGLFKELGEEKLTFVESSHGGLPKKVYNLDADGNGRSDFIEDMFCY